MGDQHGERTRRRPTSTRSRASSSAATAAPSSATHGSAFVVALAAGRGAACDVGIAAVSLSTAECTVCQHTDVASFARTLHRLHVLDPIEIVVPAPFAYPHKTKLFALVEENFAAARIVPFPRQAFNDAFGSVLLEQLSVREELPALQHALSGKVFALAAVAALVKYIETVGKVRLTQQSVRFNHTPLEGTMLIDPATARNLELVHNANSLRSTVNLFGTLNRTLTAGGARMLRTNILQPPCTIRDINARLDAVTELSGNEYVHMSLRDALRGMVDIDTAIASIVQLPAKTTLKAAEQLVNNVIAIKFILKRLPLLLEPLTYTKNELLRAIAHSIENDELRGVSELIDETLNDDITYQRTALGLRNQRCYAVRANHNELLDVARQTYKESTNDAYELASSYATQHDLPIKIAYNAGRGFHLTIHEEQISRTLPVEFINVVRHRKLVTFTTLSLMSINDRIQESLVEILLMSNKIIAELTERVREHIFSFYKLSEAVSMLDMLLSFSELSKTAKCTCSRPLFGDDVCVVDAVHPVKSQMGREHFVPNNIVVDACNNVQLVTGPNMSGKSTYLRETALISVMAQIGCVVPARRATLRVISRLVARVGSDSNADATVSSFTAEMQQTAAMLAGPISRRTLLVLDEVGRGTGASEGAALAIAVCETLAATDSIALVATHFVAAARRLAVYPNVELLRLVVDSTGGATFGVADGAARSDGYGIELARRAGFPNDVLEFANRVVTAVHLNTNVREDLDCDSDHSSTRNNDLNDNNDKVASGGENDDTRTHKRVASAAVSRQTAAKRRPLLRRRSLAVSVAHKARRAAAARARDNRDSIAVALARAGATIYDDELY